MPPLTPMQERLARAEQRVQALEAQKVIDDALLASAEIARDQVTISETELWKHLFAVNGDQEK